MLVEAKDYVENLVSLWCFPIIARGEKVVEPIDVELLIGDIAHAPVVSVVNNETNYELKKKRRAVPWQGLTHSPFCGKMLRFRTFFRDRFRRDVAEQIFRPQPGGLQHRLRRTICWMS